MVDLYVLYVCDACGAYDFAPEEIGHRGRCPGRHDSAVIKRLTLMPVAEESTDAEAAQPPAVATASSACVASMGTTHWGDGI